MKAVLSNEQQKEANDYCNRVVPMRYKNLYCIVTSGKGTPMQRQKARCSQCVGYETTINRIRECNVYICPDWPYRPYMR